MNNEQLASKSFDIQVSLGTKQVPEFENLPRIGMMVNLSLHIRGLPVLEYDKLRLASSYYFNIPPTIFREVILSLAEVEFVRLDKQGHTIKKVIPQVPYFDSVYEKVGEYAGGIGHFNEPEQLALKILDTLSKSPTEVSNLHSLGADKKILQRNLQIGNEGGYILSRRARGKDILLSPLFFSENSELFSDLTAKAGARKIQRILDLIKKAQGWPLAIIEKDLKINGEPITKEELSLIKRLAQDGVVKPPSINTPHSGINHFIFTPTPGGTRLNASNKEIYERAMALVSSVRQGQFLPKAYRIRWPEKILAALKRNGYLNPTSETYNQYHQLALMKVGRLEKTYGDRYRFRINETEENMKALDLAIQLVETGEISDLEINENARIAIQKDQSYIESIISSSKMRETENVVLDEETREEIDDLLIKGIS